MWPWWESTCSGPSWSRAHGTCSNMAMGVTVTARPASLCRSTSGRWPKGTAGRGGRQEQLDLLVGEWGGEPLLAACEEEGMGTALDGDLGGWI